MQMPGLLELSSEHLQGRCYQEKKIALAIQADQFNLVHL